MVEPVIIGDATLYLGDAIDILPSLGKIDSVVSDPPFGMDFQSNHRIKKHLKIQNDKTEDLLKWCCSIPADHASYVFCRWNNLASVPPPTSVVTWVKNNHSMGDLEHEHGRQTELCLFYPGANHFFPAGRPNDVIKAPRTGNEHHPTEKPVQLMRAIIEWTRGTVVDPFMGSCSTGVAAVQMGRKFIGIEKEPEHFYTAIERIKQASRQSDLFILPDRLPPEKPADLFKEAS